MIWSVNRYVQRYWLTDRPLVSIHLWAAPWIQLRRANHYSIIKIIRQIENSKSIWLYLFYSLVITITIMSDGGALFHVRSEAQAHVKAQMQEISINKNDVGGYKRSHWSNRSTASSSSSYSESRPMGWSGSSAQRQTLSQVKNPTSTSRRATPRYSRLRKHKRPAWQSISSRPRSRRTPMHKTRRTDRTRQGLRRSG